MLENLKKSKLATAAGIYVIGTIFIKGLNFFTLPFFIKRLTTDEYGLTMIYLTWVSILTVFVGLSSQGTISSAKANLEENEFDKYLSSVLTLGTMSFIVISIICILFKSQVSKILQLEESIVYILLIQSFSNFVISFASAKYTINSQPMKYLKVNAGVAVLNVGLSISITLLLKSKKYLGMIYGNAIASVLIAAFLYITIIRQGKKTVDKKYWKFCLPIAIPLIFHSLSALILNQSDRIMLQKLMDNSVTGIYGFAYTIAVMINILNMAINNAWVAWYFESMKKKEHSKIRSKAKIYIILFTIITGLFILGSPEVVKILGNKNYWEGIALMPIIVAGYFFVFLYTFNVNYEFYKKKTKYIAAGTIIAGISNIVMNFILIPKMGMQGAAIATLISYIILFSIHEIIVRYIFKYAIFPIYYYINAIISVSIVIGLYYCFIDNFLLRWSIIIVVIMIAIVFVIKNIDKLKEKPKENI